MVDASHNYLEPHPQILEKLLILRGCSSFRFLRENGGDDFLGHVLSLRTDVVNSSSLSLLHVQKHSNILFSYYYLDTKNMRDNVMIVAVSKSPKFFHQICVDRIIETVEVGEPTPILQFWC